VDREQRNKLTYIAIFTVNVIAGWAIAEISGGKFLWFEDPANASFKSLALALLGPAVMGLTAWLAANTPR